MNIENDKLIPCCPCPEVTAACDGEAHTHPSSSTSKDKNPYLSIYVLEIRSTYFRNTKCLSHWLQMNLDTTWLNQFFPVENRQLTLAHGGVIIASGVFLRGLWLPSGDPRSFMAQIKYKAEFYSTGRLSYRRKSRSLPSWQWKHLSRRKAILLRENGCQKPRESVTIPMAMVNGNMQWIQ